MSLRAYVESRGLNRPAKFAHRLRAFRADSEGWFDGTPHSVDRRLATCRSLIHEARTLAADDPVDQLHILAELDSDRAALDHLRDDMLSGGSSRHAKTETNQRALARLHRLGSADDRRWVELEAARFYRDQTDAARHDVTEMAEQACRHADVHAPTRVAAQAFTAVVTELARKTPRPRIASARPVFRDHPDELLFL